MIFHSKYDPAAKLTVPFQIVLVDVYPWEPSVTALLVSQAPRAEADPAILTVSIQAVVTLALKDTATLVAAVHAWVAVPVVASRAPSTPL